MSDHNLISDEQLNALLDNELDDEERTQILNSIAQNPNLQARYEELQRLKDMVVLAYRDVPQPKPDNPAKRYFYKRYFNAFASAALLLLGIFGGWFIGIYSDHTPESNIRKIEQINISNVNEEKILLHIGTNDSKRVQTALQSAEDLLHNSSTKHTHLILEVVANADGLSILRKGSPYAEKIATLTKEYENVKFLACGIAKQNAALKEGKTIELIPEAKDIPAALDQILNRLQEGWTYVRG